METVSGTETEMFSNPIAPQEEEFVHPTEVDENVAINKLSNSDFRKLMMTPRADNKKTPSATPDAASTSLGKGGQAMGPPVTGESAMERRRKKKAFYAKVKKLEQERDDDLAQRYRDRAKERREVAHKGDAEGEAAANDADNLNTTADYRAVAPTSAAGESYAERRRQLIEESKYLGGDMEHTHLVKGLDFALLEKVRAEITSKEREAQELDLLAEHAEEESAAVERKEEEKMQFVSAVGKSVYRVLFKKKPSGRNELFAPGRMAYRIDLEEEYAELDVPTTVIRSKADCVPVEGQASGLTTNEMVINKLTQILSYLRAGRRQAKRAKLKGKLGQGGKDEEKTRAPEADMDIFDDAADYLTVGNVGGSKRRGDEKTGGGASSRNQAKDRDRGDRDRDRADRNRDRSDRDRGDRGDRDRDRGGVERDRGDRADKERDRGDRRDRDRDQRDRRREPERSQDRPPRRSTRATESAGEGARVGAAEGGEGGVASSSRKKSYFEKPEDERDTQREAGGGYREGAVREMTRRLARKMDQVVDQEKTKEKDRIDRIRRKTEISGYDECYPGFAESYDAMGDSDDEADFSQMDMGNKKGPVGRWDFENQDEYSAYMSNKEAMPKAAFQYGVKMADGRRTRRLGPKDERAELNRQWQKIQSMMNKRKEMSGESGGGSASKQAKHSE